MKHGVINLLMVAVSLAVGYVIVEIGYRAYLYYTYAIVADYGLSIVDVRLPSVNLSAPGNVFGPQPQNTTYTMTQYTLDNRQTNRHRVRINNLGWVSHHDYTVAKSPDEYRIAIVGASLTASVTNEYPWPDVLQQRFNNDRELLAQLGVQRFTVLNFGLPGAPFQNMVNPLAVIARRFSPDLQVINFAIEDVLASDPERPFVPIPEEPATPPDATAPQTSPYQPDLVVDGVEIRLSCPSAGARAVSNPDCQVLPIWYVPPGREISSSELTSIKRTVARQFLLHRVLLTYRPLALLELLGRPVIPRAQAAEMSQAAAVVGQDPRVAVPLRAFEMIKQMHPNLMITHNPLYWHLTRQRRSEMLEGFISLVASRGFDIVQLEQYLPIQRGEGDWSRWYNPDGHWSDYGAEIYGEAMYRVIRRRLLATRGIVASAEDAACASSFARFRSGQAAAQQGDKDAALASFDAAIAALPADASERSGRAVAYEDCGFLADLHADRSMALEERGDGAVAAAEWEQALVLAPDPFAYYLRRASLRLARGDRAAAIADQGELIRRHPNDAVLYRERGLTLLAAGNPAAAVPDFTAALAYNPNDPALLFNRAQARIVSGDYDGAVADADTILALSPGNAGVLFLRSGAKMALGRLEEALADLTAAIELMPGQAAFHQGRADILDRLGRHEEAAAERRTALSATPGAVLPAEDTACSSAFARFRDGQAAAQQGDKDAALAGFDAAIAALPADATERFRRAAANGGCSFLADLHAGRSMVLEERGDGAAAAAEWEQALALAPDPFVYYQQRASRRLARGDQAGAIADQDELIRRHPDDAALHRARGSALLAAGNPAAAIPDFTAALTRYPNDLALLFNRAQARIVLADYDGAVADADTILALSPGNGGVLFLRGGAKMALGRLEEALADLTAAIELMPGQAAFHQGRADILDRLGRHEEAATERRTAQNH